MALHALVASDAGGGWNVAIGSPLASAKHSAAVTHLNFVTELCVFPSSFVNPNFVDRRQIHTVSAHPYHGGWIAIPLHVSAKSVLDIQMARVQNGSNAFSLLRATDSN